ncbi:MAG: M48 family metalloprotease [Caulobacterales bacterium]
MAWMKRSLGKDGAKAGRLRRNLFLAGLGLTAAACATIDSTPDAPSVTASDRGVAAKQHPQILQEFGGAVQGPAATYVNTIGQKVATAAGLPGQCTFTVVNSDVVNAFAVPGCYIYITRGLLAIMNTEDELASVLGHEVGHVTADHSARRQNTAMASQLGALLVGVLSGSGQIAQAAGQLGQMYSLNYSRDQEFQADDLGVRYISKVGYNPYAAADMLNALGTNDALTTKISGRGTADPTPAWARTHPLSADRVVRAKTKAQAAGAVPGQPPEIGKPYLDAIRGLMFGDDPEQGFIMGHTFAHPKLKIAFDAPEGYVMQNSPSAIIVAGAGGKAQFQGGKMPAEGLDAYTAAALKQIIGEAPAQIGQRQSTTTNGLETVIAPSLVQNSSGQLLNVVVYAYKVKESVYSFVTLSAASAAQPFTAMTRSFRALSDAEAAKLKARQIELVTVGPKDTAETISRRMAFDDFKLDRFLAINGRAADTPLKAGEVVKIVSYAK